MFHMTTTAIVTEVGLLLVPTTTATDYANAYRAARQAKHTATTMAAEWAAEDKANRIADLAERASVALDLITLDVEARA